MTAGNEGGARQMVRHSSIYAFGNLSRNLVGFLMLPIYTRYLTPADYGVIGLMTFAISLIELVFGARMAKAVPKFYYDDDYRDQRPAVISTAMVITAVASCAAMIGLILVREPASSLMFGVPDYAAVVGVFAVLILGHAIENYGLTFLRIQRRPWLFVGVSLAKLVVQLSLNIWLVVVLDMGVMGVAISAAISTMVFALGLGLYTLFHTGIGFRKWIGWQMFKYCWPLWVAGFAGLYIGSANRYFIRVFSSLDDVGLFELAVKFSAALALLVWQPFDQYWQTERFRLHQKGNAEEIFQDVFYVMAAVLLLSALAISLLSEPVIRIMADPAFHPAIDAVPYLVFGTAIGLLAIYLNFSFLVMGKTLWISQNQYVMAAIVTVFYLALIPVLGFVGAAIAALLAALVQMQLVYWRGRKEYDMGISLVPVFAFLVIVSLANVVAVQLRAADLLFDMLVKGAILLVAGVVVMLVLFRNPRTRRRVLSLLPQSGFGSRKG